MKKYLFLIITFIINAQSAFCEEAAFGTNLDSSLKTHSSGTGIGTVIFALVFVVCLIYVTGIIYTRLNAIGAKTVKKQLRNYKLDNIIMLSTLQLGQGKNLHVVETNGKKILVGSTANSVNIIKDLGDDEDFLEEKTNGKENTLNDEDSVSEVKEAKEEEEKEDIKAEENIISPKNDDKFVVDEKFEEKENFDLYKKYL